MTKIKTMKIIICMVMVFSLSFNGLGFLFPTAHAADADGHAEGCTDGFGAEDGVCDTCGAYEPASIINDETSEHYGYYAIGSYGNLMWFAQQINGLKIDEHRVVLTADIYISKEMEWEPIAHYGDGKKLSVFDGDGHTLNIVRDCDTGVSDSESHGLFDRYNYGIIEDLFLSGELNVNSYGNVGGLVAQAYRTTIRNVTSTVKVTNNDKEGGTAGGLVGYFGGKHEEDLYSKIENCAVYADVTGYTAGGIVGRGWNGDQYYDMTNVVYKGNVTAHEGGAGGAIVGYQSTDGGTSSFTNVYWLEEDGIDVFGMKDTDAQVYDNASAVTNEQLLSGEIAYKLSQSASGDVWGQKIGVDEYPVLNGAKVYYGAASCKADAEWIYNNTNEGEAFHSPDENGLCTVCEKQFGASVDRVCYETLAEALEALSALDEIAEGTLVTVYEDQNDYVVIPAGVVFDGNGRTFFGGAENYGTIAGGTYKNSLYNYGVIEKAALDGWYSGAEGSLIRPAKVGDVTFGENYVLFGNDGELDCGEHIGGEAACDTLAVCDFCHREYGEFLEHDVDENGKCKDCDYCYAAVVDGEFYDTLEGAMEAVIAILDNFTVPEEEMPSEAAIALGLAEMPRPEAQRRTVKLLKDAKLAFEIPEGVIFDGNGYEVNSADGIIENYGEIVGGRYTGVLYNYGRITKATLDGWFVNGDGAELINQEAGAISFGESFAPFGNAGKIKCEAHFGGKADCKSLAVCEFCGEEYGEYGVHSTDAEGDRAASCEELAYCSVCEKEYGDYEEHDFNEATCEDPEICMVCDEIEGQALEHDFASADCTTPKTCKICGETEGEALGHDYGDWTVTKEAKVGEAGEKESTCSRCNDKKTEAIPALEPTPVAQNDGEEKEDEEPTEKPTEKPTDAPKVTEKATEPAEEKKGCGGTVATTAMVIGTALALGAAVVYKKKDDE